MKEIDGDNSAKKYVKEGQDVKRGDVIGEVGRTGQWAGNAEHVHYEVWINNTGEYVIMRDKEDQRRIRAPNSSLTNPHDLWARHPLDTPKEKKYIPFWEKEKNGSTPESVTTPVRMRAQK